MRLIFAVLLATLCAPALAAYHLSASALGTSGADTVTVTDPGCSAGDELILAIQNNFLTSETITWPSGFTQLATADNTGANRGVQSFMAVAWATSTASTYTVTVNGGNGTTVSAILVCNSGRTTGAPSNHAQTTNGTGGTSPLSVALTGLTASANDDLLWFGGVNASATWVYTAPTSFTSRQTQSVSAANGYGFNLSTEDAVGAGATGTITGTATASGKNADTLGIVVALPSGGAASCTHSGLTSSGAISVPTASTTVVRLASGALSTVDCSAVSYKQSSGAFGVN